MSTPKRKLEHSTPLTRKKQRTGATVSVIIPVYNAEKWLDECLASVIAQDFDLSRLQVCIFDDSSTDSSQKIILDWKDKFSAKNIDVAFGTNDGSGKGCGFAKNKAVALATGDYLCFLDSDDIMLPSRITMQLKKAEDNHKAIIGSNFIRVPEDATPRYTQWCNSLTNEQLVAHAFREVTIIHPTWFYHKSVYDKVGGYDNTTDAPEDMIFFYKHLVGGGKLFKINKPLLKYRYHGDMTSHKIDKKALMTIKAKAFEALILPKWESFMIWGAGRDGKLLYKKLSVEAQQKVAAFCDVNEKKIGTDMVLNHTTKQKVPVKSWKEITSPFVTCVTLDRFSQFEKNLEISGYKEGADYYPLV